jgi:uncharacterized damage-inducible protein DinB
MRCGRLRSSSQALGVVLNPLEGVHGRRVAHVWKSISQFHSSNQRDLPHYNEVLSRVGRDGKKKILGSVKEYDGKRAHWKSLSKRQILIKKHCETVLRQTAYLLEICNDEDYVKKLPDFFNATIGAHIRHLLQHTHHVLDMVGSHPEDVTTLTYDDRERGEKLERSREKALRDNSRCLSVLESIEADDFVLLVHAEFIGDAESGKKYAVSSTIERELSFVAHHATHHLALINLMLKSLGYNVYKNVGIANSTAMHHKDV